eukprot:m.450460 g.450460  ORF g.450460 m.450460 type:complete len:85 (-) comp20320_c5_seq7:2315-2569(-)
MHAVAEAMARRLARATTAAVEARRLWTLTAGTGCGCSSVLQRPTTHRHMSTSSLLACTAPQRLTDDESDHDHDHDHHGHHDQHN